LNAKELANDIDSGLDRNALRKKYGFSDQQVDFVYRKLGSTGLLDNVDGFEDLTMGSATNWGARLFQLTASQSYYCDTKGAFTWLKSGLTWRGHR
jgi:hypothetical protein